MTTSHDADIQLRDMLQIARSSKRLAEENNLRPFRDPVAAAACLMYLKERLRYRL